MKINKELIINGRSANGGWNRQQVVLLGLEWPLAKGWKDTVIGREIADEKAQRFIKLKGQTIKKERRDKTNVCASEKGKGSDIVEQSGGDPATWVASPGSAAEFSAVPADNPMKETVERLRLMVAEVIEAAQHVTTECQEMTAFLG